MAAHACSPSTLEAETSGPSGVRDQSGLNSKLEAIQSYTVSYNKENKIETKLAISTHRTRHSSENGCRVLQWHPSAYSENENCSNTQEPKSRILDNYVSNWIHIRKWNADTSKSWMTLKTLCWTKEAIDGRSDNVLSTGIVWDRQTHCLKKMD